MQGAAMAADMDAVGPIGLLGAGRMGGALIEGWTRAGAIDPKALIIIEPHPSDPIAALGARLNPPASELSEIRTLILAMLYRLVPTLIQAGKVYIAESPLFEISTKGNTYFAYSEKEKQEILARVKGKYSIQRSKGLGENEPEMMWQTTMNPETRRLIKVVPEDLERTEQLFDLLLGDNLQGRKEYIETNGYRFLDMIDVS